MLLSVIIPVYRVEHTLQRCVESVLSQGVDNMEVILVDDGSPDNCPVLCDGWAEKDARVKVIHKDNGGLSDARNAGIEMATGDYLSFVDSDDYVEDDTYPALLQIMAEHPDYDLLEYPIVNRLSLEDRTYQQTQEYWLDTKAYLHTYAWNKIYRRHLFDDIRFPVGKIFEDVYTFPQLLRAATTIAIHANGGLSLLPQPSEHYSTGRWCRLVDAAGCPSAKRNADGRHLLSTSRQYPVGRMGTHRTTNPLGCKTS